MPRKKSSAPTTKVPSQMPYAQQTSQPPPLPPSPRPACEVLRTRQADWRCGGIVYQVFVDRFAPSQHLEDKLDHYSPPRRLRPWSEVPARGRHLPEEGNIEGELEFWGGDLDSLRGRLDYIQGLGAEVVYLNPIFEAFTNHKYDTMDYERVDPQYGSNEDLRALCGDLHARGMRLILDGVFNHVGRRMPAFQRALADPAAPERAWFTIHSGLPHGYLSWRNVRNLPELNLENPDVRGWVYESRGSVVQRWLREYEIDGWRLDVAPDLGLRYLRELTDAAHAARPGCAVLGECWNYPEEWLGVLDGILNLHLRSLIVELARGKMRPPLAQHAVERMIHDAGIEGILRCHTILDNHDTPRLATLLPSIAERNLTRVLQFALPGCPVIYYGSELGMGSGGAGGDMENRAPMRWDLASEENADLQITRQLAQIRRANPALRIGDYRALDAGDLFAFLRMTGDPRQTILCVVNPSGAEVTESIAVRDSLLMDCAAVECLLSGERVMIRCGWLEARVPPQSARLYRTTDQGGAAGYSMFKRVVLSGTVQSDRL